MPAPRPLLYTFANHMHWVDMQWLWGYSVLPGSVDDMLRLCRDAGVKGNVNFDGVGYEKMAAECPEALAALRAAVGAGTIEPVGCSYGQPYGLFHGGESNVRQLTYGARTVRRLLGVRPRTFWEEEFYFFPQLPQLLAQCGFTGACLFFQWTWHTPELPREPHALILWEGADGTRLPALPRNALNVHQWPEDFDGLLDSGLIRELPAPAVVQWLELMPGRDWMCRSELLLPRLKDLVHDPRFELRPGTAAEVIAGAGAATPEPPVRRYTLDDAWHGVSLGKNGDNHPRASALLERQLIGAESMAALAGFLGRPYASWDVYPTWELEESWRELLAAQHHDNHECEGLCGFVGEASFTRAEELSKNVLSRTVLHIARRAAVPEGTILALNPTGIPRSLYFTASEGIAPSVVRDVPPFGYAAIPIGQGKRKTERVGIAHGQGLLTLSRGGLSVTIDKRRGTIVQVKSPEFPGGLLAPDRPLLRLVMSHDGREDRFEHASVEVGEIGGEPVARIVRQGRDERQIYAEVKISALHDAFDIVLGCEDLPRPGPRMHAGLQLPIAPAFPLDRVVAESPYTQEAVRADGQFKRKYPTGDWMTSPQVFEDIRRPFTALSWLDLLDESGRGLLITHDGGQQFFRDEHGIVGLLSMYDAWDEGHFNGELHARLLFRPHGPLSDGQRARAAAEQMGNWSVVGHEGPPGDGPQQFGMLWVEGAPNVMAEALFRESMKSGEHLPQWAGHRMHRESGGACDHPFVIRLVEWGGEPADVTLKLPGPVAMAAKTNLMGEVLERGVAQGGAGVPPAAAPPGFSAADTRWLGVEPTEPPEFARAATLRAEPIPWFAVRFAMRPREIATIYADLVPGRKQWRDLDAKREVWAKVHREPGSAS